MKTRRRKYVLPILVVAALLSSTAARAASVVLNDTWQNLGTGPLLLQTLGGDGLFEASATAPTDTGLALGKNSVPFAYSSTLAIWGKRRSPSYTTTVIYSPLTIAGGGGGGGSGGAVYGNNATGTAPSQPPVFTSGVDSAGNIKPFYARADGSEGTFSPDVRAVSQTLAAAAGSFIDIPVNGQSVVGLRFAGLTASGATITYFSSNDATQTPTSPISSLNASTGVTSPTRTTDGETRVPVSGRTTLRLQVTTAGTTSITVSYNVGSAGTVVDLASPLPPGTNAIGSITNTAFGANQGTPAAIAGAWPTYLSQGGAVLSGTNGLPTTDTNAANTIGSAGAASTKAQSVQGIAGGVAVPVSGTFFQATQPVSGTFFQATQPVSKADGVDVTLGAKADTAAGTGTVSAIAIFKQLHLDLIAATPAGTAQLGGVYGATTNLTGGVATLSRLVSAAATTNATLVKSSAGRVYKVYACNTATTARYFRLFNKATAPVPGTDTVFWSRALPPSATSGVPLCQSYDLADIGYYLSAGIGYDITAAAPDTDATALTAGDVTQVSVEYQ